MKHQLNILFLFFVFNSFYCFSQNNNAQYLQDVSKNTDFYHLKTPEGIEQNSITGIAQDSIGYMWFSTKDGLLRYNGTEFFVYKRNPDNQRSIGNNFVNSVFVSKDGSVWVGSIGLAKYHPETDDFEPIVPNILSDIEIYSISQDSKGIFWFIDRNSTLYRYDGVKKDLQSFEFKNHSEKTYLQRIITTRNDEIFITTNQPYFLEFIPNSKTFHSIYFMSEKEINTLPKFSNNAPSIMEDYNGDLWLASIYGFAIRYNIDKESFTRLHFNSDFSKRKDYFCMFIFEDTEKNIWIGTWAGGLINISPNRQEFNRLLPKPNATSSITNNIITSGFQDKSGYLWFGTEFAGLNILKKNKKFSVIASNLLNEHSLPEYPYTNAIKDFSGRVWVGTDGDGLYYFDSKDRKAYKTNHPILKKPKRIFTLFKGKNNVLWIGTGIGMYKYDLNTEKVDYYPRKKDDFNSLGGRNVVSLYQDFKGNIWAGTIHGGLSKLDTNTGDFYRFMPDDDNPNSLSYKYVSAIYQDSNQDLWVGTLKGLNKFNSASGNFTIFKPNNGNSISSERINCIYEQNSSLWIGTDGGGLNEYDLKTKTFKYYLDNDNPITHNIKGITSDNKNNLWLSTTHNLLKFNLESKQFITYSASDGLENNMYIEDYGLQQLQFFENFSSKDADGYLYFGGIGGLTIFHPDSLPKNNYKPPVILEEFLINGKKNDFDVSETIILKPDANHLEFSLIALNYIQPNKNQFAFFLKNHDSTWQYKGTDRHIEYLNLPKGNYEFYYKGANNDGVWSEISQPITIKVLPYFYETFVFYLVIFIIIILLILSFVFYKWYIKRELKKERERIKYTTSNLSKSEAEDINQQLISKLNNSKLYLESDLSLYKLAEILNTKPHKLSQVINQFHGRHFHDYINLYRIEEAKKLLANTYLKIEAVAFDSGFNSISTFNVAFKKATSLTPSKYREKYKNPNRT